MTSIEWTEATWNPVVGCSKVSAGCKHCYAEVMARRLASMPGMAGLYGQVVHAPGVGPQAGRWNGKVVANPGALLAPLRRKKPTMYFVNSMSDLFHEAVSVETLDAIFAVMMCCPQHTFQVLTKRPQRMRDYMQDVWADVHRKIAVLRHTERVRASVPWPWAMNTAWPPPNVWLGVSVENEEAYRQRVPLLLDTRAAVRFLSMEPLLGPVSMGLVPTPTVRNGQRYWVDPLRGAWWVETGAGFEPAGHTPWRLDATRLDWVIAGGESGHGARPMDPEWVRGIRDACVGAGVAFFFKQWGGVRKGETGRVLDGMEWDEMPVVERFHAKARRG